MNIRNFRNWDAEDVLDLLGLEYKRGYGEYMLPAIGVFALGIVVGAGIGVLFAPKEGRQLRQDISNRVQNGMQSAKEMASEMPSKLGMSSGTSSSRTTTGTSSTSSSPRNTSV